MPKLRNEPTSWVGNKQSVESYPIDDVTDDSLVIIITLLPEAQPFSILAAKKKN